MTRLSSSKSLINVISFCSCFFFHPTAPHKLSLEHGQLKMAKGGEERLRRWSIPKKVPKTQHHLPSSTQLTLYVLHCSHQLMAISSALDRTVYSRIQQLKLHQSNESVSRIVREVNVNSDVPQGLWSNFFFVSSYLTFFTIFLPSFL